MEVPQNVLLGALIVGGILVLLARIIGGFAQANKARMLEHQERMKALEMGQTLPDDLETARIKARTATAKSPINATDTSDASKSYAKQCNETTMSICAVAIFVAFLSGGSIGIGLAAATGAVGVTGLICGTILATREVRQEPSKMTKPSFDPEAV